MIVFPKPVEAPPAPRPPMRVPEFSTRNAPLPLSDELAEAVADAPRILEAPEPEEDLPLVMPPVTAITLEPENDTDGHATPGLELPLRAAPIAQRAFAGLVDASLVVFAAATFALIFVKITGGMPESKFAPVVAIAIFGVLWSIYQFLFLVYAATTPGLQVARLSVADFDGRRMKINARRQRAFGIVVAALPLGLGLFWAFVDQDMLCWHDRISHSYIVEQ